MDRSLIPFLQNKPNGTRTNKNPPKTYLSSATREKSFGRPQNLSVDDARSDGVKADVGQTVKQPNRQRSALVT